MIIAVDFDGTIVSPRYPLIGEPKPFAFDVLKQLTAEGNKIILWTYREGELLEDAVEFCRQRGLEFYAVNSDYPEGAWGDSEIVRKIHADVFIDDCNLGGLPSWPEIYSIIGSGAGLKYRKHRKGFFARLSSKCRRARRKMIY